MKTKTQWLVEKCECSPTCKSYYVRGPAFADRGLTDEADARLIAAAPELLKALRELNAVVFTLEGTPIEFLIGIRLAAVAHQARTAIAKAEGK